jgi:Protein of unknown function (DUF2971)
MTKRVWTLLKPIFDSFEKHTFVQQGGPLLAHYTSIRNLESILKEENLWFSSPLFMNDLNELRFGVKSGVAIFAELNLEELLSYTSEDCQELRGAFEEAYTQDNNEGAIDTFVFCLTEHSAINRDGKLSMWRAYGDSGNGVALIFDFSSSNTNPQSAPFALVKVQYASEDEQHERLKRLLENWASAIHGQVLSKEDLHYAGQLAYRIVKAFAISTKHIGFEEEHEWRIIYMREFDEADSLRDSMSYHVDGRGIQPKLKLKVADLIAASGKESNFEKLLHSVILGPSHHANLTWHATKKMLETLSKQSLVNKMHQSRIPFRPS